MNLTNVLQKRLLAGIGSFLIFLLGIGLLSPALANDGSVGVDLNAKQNDRANPYPALPTVLTGSLIPDSAMTAEVNAKQNEKLAESGTAQDSLITQNVAPPGTQFIITDINPLSAFYSTRASYIGKTATATTCSGSNAGVTDPGINLITSGPRQGWYDACFYLPGDSTQYYIYGFRYQTVTSTITQNVAPPGTQFIITDINPLSAFYSTRASYIGKTATATTCSGSNAGVTDPGINLITSGPRQGWYDACFYLPGDSTQYYIYGFKYMIAAPAATIVEYYHAGLDNYFITSSAGEQAYVDGGGAGAWQRTGATFKSGGPDSVCRFYGSALGPNSHFYTADSNECAQLKAIYNPSAKSWKFESYDFATTKAVNGGCAAGLVPVYRAYNNGFARGVDSNHRISTNYASIQQVVAKGWLYEGVVMCAPN